MTSTFLFWFFACSAVLIHGLSLVVILLLLRKGNLMSNRYLAFILIVFWFSTAHLAIRVLGWEEYIRPVRFLPILLWMLLPPLVYLYTRISIGFVLQWSWKSMIHLLPVSIVAADMSFFHPWIRQFQEAISPGAHAEAGRMMYNLLYTLQIVVYLILSFRLIRQVRPVPVGLKILLSIVLLDTVVGFFAATYQFVTHSHTLDSQEISTLLSFVIIYVLTYLGIVGPQHLFYRRATGLGNSTHPSSHEAMVTRLKRLMESEKLYRDSNLKYSDIAARLGVSVRALSSALNETLGQSFTDFINTYRVHEAQELISVRSDDTLLGIAFSSGFNSKSSFNRSFRKLTGMSPSAYAARFQNVSRT